MDCVFALYVVIIFIHLHRLHSQSTYKIGDAILHIELRRWADIVLVAPCSANTLAKIANGICDNLVVRRPSHSCGMRRKGDFSIDITNASTLANNSNLCLPRYEYLDVRASFNE